MTRLEMKKRCRDEQLDATLLFCSLAPSLLPRGAGGVARRSSLDRGDDETLGMSSAT